MQNPLHKQGEESRPTITSPLPTWHRGGGGILNGLWVGQEGQRLYSAQARHGLLLPRRRAAHHFHAYETPSQRGRALHSLEHVGEGHWVWGAPADKGSARAGRAHKLGIPAALDRHGVHLGCQLLGAVDW